jgi:peptidoglycan/LPS O-acetylase OafA/YrhL
VLSHTALLNGNVFVGGRNAVQMFYMISGFLISHVIVNNKVYLRKSSFYMSRGLRIYPVYYVVLLLSIAADFFADPWYRHIWAAFPDAIKFIVGGGNVTILGQDWFMFMGLDHSKNLHLTANIWAYPYQLWQGLLIPQGWTLGVELSFYLLAPFLLRSRTKIVIALILSIALRIMLLWSGIGEKDPWTYRFFPTELALFLVGALSNQVFLPYIERFASNSKKGIEVYGTLISISLIIAYFLVPISDICKTIFILFTFPFLLPFAFIMQGKFNFDKLIRELSYPVYICHVLVIRVVGFVAHRLGIGDIAIIAFISVIGSLAFAALLDVIVARPIELFRNRIKGSQDGAFVAVAPAMSSEG